MNQNTGSRPLPPPPPSTLGRTNTNIPISQKGNIQDSNPPKKAVGVKSEHPRRSSGQPSLEYIIKKAYDKGYSDIHLGVEEIPRMRDRGEMALTEYPKTDLNTFMSWIHEVLTDEEVERFKQELEFDGATQYEFARVRINIFDTLRGPALVMRLIPLKILTMEQLGLPPVFRDISDAHKGLVLVTGPTGSGKSTTMAAMVDYINNEHAKHIITIEDPIEFVHQSKRSLVKQREVGINTLKFDLALKASLREDPDIILIGEMRDRETVDTALKAAQTGHLVMGTLHTNSAVKTIERILTLYSAEEQDAMRMAISESLVAVISQGLCRTTDGKRAAYHDIMVNTETVKDYIKQGKYDEIQNLMQDGEYDGMITSNQALFRLYEEGKITEEVALEMSPTANEMAMMLRGRL
jgi:twitching motility protein PilT